MMPEVPKGSGYYLIQFESFLFEAGYWGGHILVFPVYRIYYFSLGKNFYDGHTRSASAPKGKTGKYDSFMVTGKSPAPLVSIIVPAYNEEVNAVSSLNNLLKTDYPNFEIIFVDDGSKDSTYEKVNAAFKAQCKGARAQQNQWRKSFCA